VPTPVKQCSEGAETDSTPSSAKANQQPSTSDQPTPPPPKKKRKQWSIDDKNHFFDAVAIVRA